MLRGSNAARVGRLDTAPHTKVGSCTGCWAPAPPASIRPGPWSALGTWAKLPARLERSAAVAVAEAAASALEDRDAFAAAAAALIEAVLMAAEVGSGAAAVAAAEGSP